MTNEYTQITPHTENHEYYQSDSASMGKDLIVCEFIKTKKVISLLAKVDILINDLEIVDLEIVSNG